MGPLKESVFDAGLLGHPLGVVDHGVGLFLGEVHEVAAADLEDVVDEAFEGRPIGDGQVALEDDAVKAGEHGDDQAGKLGDEARQRLHGVLRWVGGLKQTPFCREDAVFAHPFWLRLCRVRKSGGFWEEHVKRYTSCFRRAPTYWLLQSSKKNYALWIYYHRLDKDILFKALLNYVEPKVRKEESRLGELRSQKTALEPAAKGAKKIDKDIERQEGLLSELRDFEDKLRRAANLNLVPDLNDGVVLNIAPLRELVPWKEARSYWDDLMAGKYEWSSIGKQLREKGLVP